MEGRADMDVLVPAWFACRQLEITKQTLNYWRTTGRLLPARYDSAGRPLYRYGDVTEAEKQARRHPNSPRNPERRHSPVGTRA